MTPLATAIQANENNAGRPMGDEGASFADGASKRVEVLWMNFQPAQRCLLEATQ